MRRRALLRATVGAGALPLVGRARATTRTAYEPSGSVPVPGAKETVVDGAGRYAYLAVTDGFAVVDLSDPTAPELVFENRAVAGDIDGGPLEQVYDVKLDRANDLLAVTGPAQGGGDLRGFGVFDVSDPTAPSRVSFTETPFFNHNCDIDGGTVYLCGNDGRRNAVVMYDAESGERLDDWSVVDDDERWRDVYFGNWVLHDVQARDGTAYLAQWDAGTWVVDVSDPTAPELVSRVRGRPVETFLDMANDEAQREAIEPPGNDHTTGISDTGEVLCIGVESWDANGDGEGGPGGVTLYDISDPSSPVELSALSPPVSERPGFRNEGHWTTSHNFEFQGDLLYTSWYAGGVRLHDVSDPSNPRPLADFRNDTTSFWTAQAATEEFFVATSRRDPTRDSNPQQGAALYTFPVVRERVSTPGPTVTPTPTAAPSPTPSPSPSPTVSPTASPTPSETASPTVRPPDPTPTESTSPGGSNAGGAGFGVLAALSGLGLGAYRYLRRDRDERSE